MIEPEVAIGRRAFPAAQALLAGALLTSIPDVSTVGWHETFVDGESGAFAVVRFGLEELRGEIVKVTAGDRSCFVYVVGARDVPVDLSLARRAFLSLAPLWTEQLAGKAEAVLARS